MNHKGTITIETERLILRPFVENDSEAAYKNWASIDDVTKYLTWPTHSSVDVTKMVINDWISQYKEPDYYQWAIELKEIGEPIGSISVVEKDDNVGEVEVGYCIGKNWWHQGIVSEAFNAYIDFFFEEVGVNRIGARHATGNPNSGLVMKKCGLSYEGTLRQSGKCNMGIVDMCHYSILKSEWVNNK